jgi:hypothetical protein
LCLQELNNLRLWQEKFGFKKLGARSLKALQSSVPALNFYEESTLLVKPLKHHGSRKQQRSNGGKGSVEQPQQQQQQQQWPDLPVEPLKA